MAIGFQPSNVTCYNGGHLTPVVHGGNHGAFKDLNAIQVTAPPQDYAGSATQWLFNL